MPRVGPDLRPVLRQLLPERDHADLRQARHVLERRAEDCNPKHNLSEKKDPETTQKLKQPLRRKGPEITQNRWQPLHKSPRMGPEITSNGRLHKLRTQRHLLDVGGRDDDVLHRERSDAAARARAALRAGGGLGVGRAVRDGHEGRGGHRAAGRFQRSFQCCPSAGWVLRAGVSQSRYMRPRRQDGKTASCRWWRCAVVCGLWLAPG